MTGKGTPAAQATNVFSVSMTVPSRVQLYTVKCPARCLYSVEERDELSFTRLVKRLAYIKDARTTVTTGDLDNDFARKASLQLQNSGTIKTTRR